MNSDNNYVPFVEQDNSVTNNIIQILNKSNPSLGIKTAETLLLAKDIITKKQPSIMIIVTCPHSLDHLQS